MRTINKDLLKVAANKLMFTMDESQYDTLLEEFHTILKQMDIIGEIKGVDDVEPMTFPFDVTTSYLREDEIEAPLDEANVDQFGHYIRDYQKSSQFIVITHKKRTMEYADVLYGITMQESGVSKLVSVKLEGIK